MACNYFGFDGLKIVDASNGYVITFRGETWVAKTVAETLKILKEVLEEARELGGADEQ